MQLSYTSPSLSLTPPVPSAPQARQQGALSKPMAQTLPVPPTQAQPSFGFVEGLLETMGLFAVEIVEWEILSRLLQAPLAFVGGQLSRLGRCLSHHFEQWFGHSQPPKPAVK